MAGLVRNRAISYQRIPGPEGMTGAEASTVYRDGPGQYPEMPIPATQFVTSTTSLRSLEIVPSVGRTYEAAVVDRSNRMNGYQPTAGMQDQELPTPQRDNTPRSSAFQPVFVGPIVNYVKNLCLYRAGYPAATVMNGGRHNLAWSTRVDQLPTRSTGGPGPAMMTTSQRRFTRVQTIPRYPTMPKAYKTESAPG